jgi:hypothetical protein
MMFFIPVKSILEDEYTPEQRDKFIFNHESYLGEENCMAIFGLDNLNSQVPLTNNDTVTLWSLLKGIPDLPGMSQPWLFLTVDPNATQTCTLVTFQKPNKGALTRYFEERITGWPGTSLV